MSAEPRTIRTEAEKQILDAYDAIAGSLPGGADVRARRDAAMDLFARLGLPHRRIEEWKYTDLRALMRKAPPPAARPDAAAASAALAEHGNGFASVGRFRLVLVDGYLMPHLSDVAALADAGVTVRSAAEVLAGAGDAADTLDAGTLPGNDIAVALNAAFATDGVVVTIPDGAIVAKPIEVAHVSGGAGTATVRNAFRIGAGANVKLAETFAGPAGVAYQTNVVTLADVGAGAAVTYARLQAEGDAAIHLGSTVFTIGAGAEVNHLAVTAGGAVSRGQVFLTTGGEHTKVGLNGATMLSGRQHADATLLIDHALPGARTRVLYKSAVDDRSRGVFQGKIIVEPDAQKTDAKMMSQALLLSEEAEFDGKPELEIFADDVQCGHGATFGQIDETQLFYLMARGVPKHEAEQLLIAAFLDDAIDALGDEALGDALKATVAAWLAKRGGRG